QLVVHNNPLLEPGLLEKCHDEVGATYDLRNSRDQITQGNTGLTLTFYENENDIDTENPIEDPESYVPQTLEVLLYVVATTQKGCSSQTTLQLRTTLYPQIRKDPPPIEECETDRDGFDEFDLTLREEHILNGLDANSLTFTYYLTKEDAEAGNDETISNPKSFINTVKDEQTVYVRIYFKNGKCPQIVPIPVKVLSVDKSNLEDRYVICFDGNGNPMQPLPIMDTGHSLDEYDFAWFFGSGHLPENRIEGAHDSKLIVDKIGVYTVEITNRASGCRIYEETLVIGSYIPVAVTIKKISKTFAENNVLEVTVVGKGEYEYRLDDGIFQSSNIFRNVLPGEHTITVRDIHGCGELVEKITVVDFPRFFTPNGDGIHDTWKIIGVETLARLEVSIFDRYGKLMFQTPDKDFEWDGTFKGSRLPSSDYWFRIVFLEDGETKEFSGHFTLKR
ncbi:MAG: T9SS type B sorting domain-containing protein, partial [Flavobacteriaceae bacterium]